MVVVVCITEIARIFLSSSLIFLFTISLYLSSILHYLVIFHSSFSLHCKNDVHYVCQPQHAGWHWTVLPNMYAIFTSTFFLYMSIFSPAPPCPTPLLFLFWSSFPLSFHLALPSLHSYLHSVQHCFYLYPLHTLVMILLFIIVG